MLSVSKPLIDVFRIRCILHSDLQLGSYSTTVSQLQNHRQTTTVLQSDNNSTTVRQVQYHGQASMNEYLISNRLVQRMTLGIVLVEATRLLKYNSNSW